MKSKIEAVKNLYSLMINRDFGVAELSRRSGVGEDFINSWFDGKSKPSIENLEYCYEALGYRLQAVEIENYKPIERWSDKELPSDIKEIKDNGTLRHIKLRYKTASSLIIKLYNRIKGENDPRFQEHIAACKQFIADNGLYETIMRED